MGGNSSLSNASYFSRCEAERDIIDFDALRKKGGEEEEETEGESGDVSKKKKKKKGGWYLSGFSEADADDDIDAFASSMEKKGMQPLECSICYDDEDKSKFVQLKCKHVFHKGCVMEWMKGIPGKGDLFTIGNSRCPMCRSWLFAKKDKEINKKVAPVRQQYKKMVNILLEADIDDKHKEILQQRKKEKDAFFDFMKNYQFFLCWECGKIYFGGMRNCAADLENEEEESIDPDAELRKIEMEKKDHLCAKCKVKGMNKNWPTSCKKHGDSFIAFKCRYCCNIANWFCFGTTHFCERCHRQYPKNKVYKCNGKPECDGQHLENGKEQCLGCVLCRKSRE